MAKSKGARAAADAPPEGTLRIEYMDMEEVRRRRWAGNPKKHADAVLDESLDEFGYTNPMLIDERSGKLVAGHGRDEALWRRKEGGHAAPEGVVVRGDRWFVPVVRGLSFKTLRLAERYLVADNRIAELGGWDGKALAKIIAAWPEEQLRGVGYDEAALVRFVAQTRGVAPAEFPAIAPETLPVNYCCPKCSYRWSGNPDPAGKLAKPEEKAAPARAARAAPARKAARA